MNNEFKYLFSSFKIGNVMVPNRIFMPNANHRFYSGLEAPNERVLRYYEARAKGGAGLIITGAHYPSALTTTGRPNSYQSDDVIPALKKQADTIHKYGTKVFGQLGHPGSYGTGRSVGGGGTWGPSPVWRRNSFAPGCQEIAHEMQVEDINDCIEKFGFAAKRFKEAGYDGIEIMAMAGMLHAQFLSLATNMRKDKYGKDMDGRTRFLLETINFIRKLVGRDFVIGVRFSADEFMDHVWWSDHSGNTLDDTKEIAKKLEANGNVDYLFPCAGSGVPSHIPPMNFPLGAFVYLAAGIKEITDLPVFCVGRINDPVQAEKILADSQADMIGMARQLVSDPELPRKAKEGKIEEICKCIACNEGCVGNYYPRLPLCCTMNPDAGNEKSSIMSPATNRKKVMVIGGGAAGLETARVAALRGHKVTLFEKGNLLAENLILASKVPGRRGFEDAVRYFTYQMGLLGVDIHFGTLVTAEMVLKQGSDAVVIATGANPFIPKIQGANHGNIKIVEMREVVSGDQEVGQNVLIVDYENHLLGLDAAVFLADKGRKVELIHESVYAGGMVDYSTIKTMYTEALGKGVLMTPLTGLKEIQGRTIIVYNLLTNTEREIEGIDTVVVCTDGRANDDLYRSLRGKVKELYAVGQCVSPRKLLDSIADGNRVGRLL
jgi:2,4-dienoyl-CoA reductase-like NADH-dependent reductase (Old Yellow Enzyme family)/thioredoxin reductase